MRSRYIQNDIMNVLLDYRKHTIQDIANEVEVSYNTVRNHLLDLSIHCPIEFFVGGRNSGGVRLKQSYSFANSWFSCEELKVIVKALNLLGEKEEKVKEILKKLDRQNYETTR